MRRFVVMLSLVVVSACGGQPTADEVPAAEQAPAAGEASDVESTALCSSADTWACYCAQFKTADTCRQAQLRRCVWAYNRCTPTYE